MKLNRFDEAAKTWDQDAKRREMASTIAGAMKKKLDFTEQDVVMDLGAGTGLVTFEIAPLIHKIYAIDTSQGMLEKLQEKAEHLKMQHVFPIHWDVFSEKPFPEPVDILVSAMAFHHLADIEKAVTRLYAVLSPQGKVAIADLVTEAGDFHQDLQGVHHFGFSKQQMEKWFADAGFQEIHFQEIYTMQRPGAEGQLKTFPVFLLTARK